MPTTKEGPTNSMKNSVYDTTDDLHGTANRAGRKMRRVFDTVSDEFSHVSGAIAVEIRNNPVRSSLIALGVGAAFGMLIRR